MNHRRSKQTRRLITATLVGLVFLGPPMLAQTAGTRRPTTSIAKAPARPPNVVLIVADDLGFADLGIHGATDLRTPNIDALARQGVRFTDAYMVSSLCAPSRAGILTGRYPQRWGLEFNPPRSDDSTFGIPYNVPTLGESLKALGYRTALIGKWHLGFVAKHAPNARGFEEFYGFMGPSHRYDRNQMIDVGEKLVHNGSVIEDKGYLTDAFAAEAERFVRAKDSKPFFLYLPFSAVHGPIYADSAHLARVGNGVTGVRRTYAAALLAMDDAVGRLLRALDQTGQAANTIVVFVSDNGGDLDAKAASNTPLRGRKGQIYEGAIRVPFIVRWPGHLTPGTSFTKPISALDLAPTLTAAAGAVPAPGAYDGVNLLPFVTGAGASTTAPHASLFWRLGEVSAVRTGNWKLVATESGGTALYDLASDIGERRDVSASQKSVVKEMQTAYASWASQQQPPRWGHDPTEPTLKMRVRRFIARLFSGK